jgi:type II secretion system protein N
MKKKAAKIISYTLFFLFCLAYFTVSGFPMEVIQDRIEKGVNQQLGLNFNAAQFDLSFPNGIVAEDVRLTKSFKDGQPGLAVFVPTAEFSISLWGLIVGRQDISFDAELLSGRVEGELNLDPDHYKVNARLHGLDLSKLSIWKQTLGLSLSGKVTGHLDLNMSAKDPKESQGTIELSVEQGGLGEGKVKGFSMPPIRLGKAQASLELAKGRAEIKSISILSDDISASMEGYLQMQKRIIQSTVHCSLRFKPSSDFLNRNPKFKDIINMTGLNKAKDQDGFFSYNLLGRLDRLQFRENRSGRP